MYDEVENEEVVRTCNHCGNKVPQEIVYRYTKKEPFDGNEDFIVDCYYFFCICQTCREPLIYYQYDLEVPEPDIRTANYLYPRQKTYSEDYIPKAVRDTYDEASRIVKLSANGYAALARKIIELICVDKEATGHTLFDKIKFLADNHLIPAVLFEMFDNIRFLGNVGVHANSPSIDHQEALILKEFVEAIIEYTYVAPEKIAKLDKVIKKKYKKEIKGPVEAGKKEGAC